MQNFASRFVKLCGGEPALWHPDHSDGLLEATNRIASTLDWLGFNAAQVKPLFDKCRKLYEENIGARGRRSNLRWSKDMDSYLGPLIRGETSACSGNVPGDDGSKNNMEIDEDVPCEICRSPIPEDGNDMIFCDLCNVCVHQTCYGVKTIPEGYWFCRPCERNINPPCILCPNTGGALKCTSDGQRWAHVSCALWIKEVEFENPEMVESILISRIPLSRWNLVCSLCRRKNGACIQCVVRHCTIAFHVTCAYDKGLKMEYKDAGEDAVKLLSYCRKHSKMKDNPKCKKQKGNTRIISSIITPQKVRHHFKRKSASEANTSVDSDSSESLDKDSEFEDSDQRSESLFQSTDNESDVSHESFESDSSSSMSDSATPGTPIKRKVRDGCTPELSPIFQEGNAQIHKMSEATEQEQIPSDGSSLEILFECSVNSGHAHSAIKVEEEEEHTSKERERREQIDKEMSVETIANEVISDEKIAGKINDAFRFKHSHAVTVDNRITSNEGTAFSFQKPIPSYCSSSETPNERSINGRHAYLTPTSETNYGKLALETKQIIQPSTALSTAARETLKKCKSELSTSTEESPLKKTRSLSLTKNEFSASKINHQASCSYDIPSTSQEFFVTHPHETPNIYRYLPEKHSMAKRKKTDSSTSSEESSVAPRKEKKRSRKESFHTWFAKSPSSVRNDDYDQFAKVVSTILQSVPPQIATVLKDKIINMCLKRHKQWRRIESKKR